MHDRERARENWSKIRRVFQKVFHSADSSLIDTAKTDVSEDIYLKEASQNRQFDRDVLKVPPEERYRYELIYQNSKLKTHSQEVADTRSFTTKGKRGSLAFVMSKAGHLYVGPHGQIGKSNLFFFHGSFLDNAPVEMAGLISITEGKITKVSGLSGHYLPDDLDLYRGIKHLQRLMPDVFRDDCIVSSHYGINSNIGEFIHMMETPNEKGIPKYQELRNERADSLRKCRKKIYTYNRLHHTMINGETTEEIDNSLKEATNLIQSSETSSEVLAIMSIIPDTYKLSFVAPIHESISRFMRYDKAQDAVPIIQELLDHKEFHIADFIQTSIKNFADRNDISSIITLIGAVPEERYLELLEPIRYSISKLTENNNPQAIVTLINSLSDEVCSELTEVTNSAIARFAANSQGSAVRLLINALPEVKQNAPKTLSPLKQVKNTLSNESTTTTSSRKKQRI